MNIEKYKDEIPSKIYDELVRLEIKELRPSQIKSIKQGLFNKKNILVCTPTASGKTLVAELAMLNHLLYCGGKVVYVVPLKALANEKFKQFSKRYPQFKTALSIGDLDSDDAYLSSYPIIITTSEKLDSLMRHHCPWIKNLTLLVVDEIHLLNDLSRGPTLEIILTLLKEELKNLQIIGLSATIGNPQEVSNWLNAQLVEDKWRPVKLDKGIIFEGTIHFKEEK